MGPEKQQVIYHGHNGSFKFAFRTDQFGEAEVETNWKGFLGICWRDGYVFPSFVFSSQSSYYSITYLT